MIDRTLLHPVMNAPTQSCFGCGAENPIGLHMHFQTDEEKMYSFITVPTTMAGWDTTVHGGILSTIMDEIMGWSVIYLLERIGVTKTMTVEFKKPLYVGAELIAVGSIQEVRSSREVVVLGEIYNQDHVLCVRTTAVFATMTPQAALRLGVMGQDYLDQFLPVLTQRRNRNSA